MVPNAGDVHARPVGAEDPLFILYTSGSTGKPKGVLHTTGGLPAVGDLDPPDTSSTLRDDDVYCVPADVGWVTGHSYIVYGPLANGATTLMFESSRPIRTQARYWEMVERTRSPCCTPRRPRSARCAASATSPVKKHDRSSLRVLGTVGEPINPDAWRWYHEVVGDGRCTVVDTWWQTETGGIMITPIARRHADQAGLGDPAVLRRDAGHRRRRRTSVLVGPGRGRLCHRSTPWPGQTRTVWGDHPRFVQTYFSTFKGYYFTGDGARRDADGYYWITGRVDDVINVTGHRMGTAEFESALVAHDAVAEAAVVGLSARPQGPGRLGPT